MNKILRNIKVNNSSQTQINLSGLVEKFGFMEFNQALNINIIYPPSAYTGQPVYYSLDVYNESSRLTSDITGVTNSQQITKLFEFDYCNVPKTYLKEGIKDWSSSHKTDQNLRPFVAKTNSSWSSGKLNSSVAFILIFFRFIRF